MPNGTRFAAAISLALLAAPLGGCSTMVKQAIHEVRGAKGEVLYIQQIEPQRVFSQYRSVDFAPATTSVGGQICPPTLLSAFDRAATKIRNSRSFQKAFPGGSPSLLVTSDVLYFQKKGVFSEAQSLTRIKAIDGGRLIADCMVRVESKSFRERGEDDLAEAALRALARLLTGEVDSDSDDD